MSPPSLLSRSPSSISSLITVNGFRSLIGRVSTPPSSGPGWKAYSEEEQGVLIGLLAGQNTSFAAVYAAFQLKVSCHLCYGPNREYQH